MKILFTEWYRDWRGTEPQLAKPSILPLDNDKILFALVVSVGNGDYDEVCIETDSTEAKACITNMLCGTGNAKLVDRPSAVVEHCALYRPGYDIYLQGRDSYFFVNPTPRPELFGNS